MPRLAQTVQLSEIERAALEQMVRPHCLLPAALQPQTEAFYECIFVA